MIERVVREVLASADFDAAVDAALDGEDGEGLVERVLASPRTERILGEAIESKLTAQLADRIVEEPGVRGAPRSGRCRARPCATRSRSRPMSIGDEMIESARATAIELDTRLERGAERASSGEAARADRAGTPVRARRWVRDPRSRADARRAAGPARLPDRRRRWSRWSRRSRVGIHPTWLAATLAGAGWVIVQVAYFAGSWAAAGRTPGMHLLGLRVQRPQRPEARPAALARCGSSGLWLAIALAFLGFVPALVDDRRACAPGLPVRAPRSSTTSGRRGQARRADRRAARAVSDPRRSLLSATAT